MTVPVTGTVILLNPGMTGPSCVALRLAASYPFMLLHAARPIPTLDAVIGVYVRGAIGPTPPPGGAGDQDVMAAPVEAGAAPSPGGECEAQ